MLNFKDFRLASISALSILVLSACSDVPSNAEAQEALQEKVRSRAILRAALTGDGSRVGDTEVQDVQVNNCESRDPMPGYTCELKYTLFSHSGRYPAETHIDPYVFIHNEYGWKIME